MELFDRTILKKDIVKILIKKFKELNLTADFKNEKWRVLNENEKTKIIDVRLNESKTNQGDYFLTLVYQNEQQKVEKVNLKLISSKVDSNLEFIRTCDLSNFKKSGSGDSETETDE